MYFVNIVILSKSSRRHNGQYNAAVIICHTARMAAIIILASYQYQLVIFIAPFQRRL